MGAPILQPDLLSALEGITICRQIGPGMVGWERAWAHLYATYPSTEHPCPNTGEVWKYLGTSNGRHHFKHENLTNGYFPGGRTVFCHLPELDSDYTLLPLAPTLWERLDDPL